MADYWKADSATVDLMLELVGEYHPDLAEVSEEGIAIVFREKATKAAPFGTARMVTALYDALIPDEIVFISWFEGGEVFRSGCTWKRGKGRVFYFRPGHETLPIFHNPLIQRVIRNGVRWAAPPR